MSLIEEQIRSLAQAWYEDFGEDLSREQAEDEANRLLGFFRILSDIHRKIEKADAPKEIKAAWKQSMERRH